MAEYYKIVSDENEVKWFYDHMLRDLKPGEAWMMCLGARDKKLSEEERKIYKLGRSEMMDEKIIRYHHTGTGWKWFIEALYKFETNKKGVTTEDGLPYPEKCLVIYFTVNPCSSLACAHDTVDYANKLDREMVDSIIKHSAEGVKDHHFKYSKVFDHLKSVHARNPSERILVDFDVDADVPDTEEFFREFSEMTSKRFPRGTYAFVRTGGGIHVVVKKSSLKSNPTEYVKEVEDFLKSKGLDASEVKYNSSTTKDEFGQNRQTSPMIPMPGTYQYQKPVVIVNKWDFD